MAGVALAVVALAVAGLGTGGGFGWLRSASIGTVASSFSVMHLEGITSSGAANALQSASIVAASSSSSRSDGDAVGSVRSRLASR